MLGRHFFSVVVGALTLAGCGLAAAAPLRVGIEPNTLPLSTEGAPGEFTGFAVELVRAIAADQKLEIEFVSKVWAETNDDFRAGRLDLLAACGKNPARGEYMIFSTPHVEFATGVFSSDRQRPPASVAEAGDRILGTTRNSLTHAYALQQGWKRIRLYDTLPDALAALNRGECEVVIAARVIAVHFIRTLSFTHVVSTNLGVPGLDYGLHIATQPTNPELLYKINRGLANIRANGVYDRIYERWIGPLEPRQVRLKDVRPYLIGFTVLVLGVAAAFIWQRRLLRRLAGQAEELRLRQEQLTLVLEGSDDGFWDWDVAAGRVERSERWAGMLGYAIAEIANREESLFQLIHPDDIPGARRFHAHLTTTVSDRYQVEYRMRAKTGEWRWILERGKVVARAPDGRPRRLAGTHTDITDRKNTEAALAENRALLKRSAHLLEQTQAVAHIGGWETDLLSQTLYWTAETFRIHETSPDDYQPTVETALQFYVPESRHLVAGAIEQAVKLGTPFALESELITARQRRIRVHITGYADTVDGHTRRIYGSIRDITTERAAADEKEHLRLKMLEAQKLESLGVLAGGIAHDFNNLLTVILANASFAREKVNASERENIVQIEAAAKRAASLCHQMLTYAGRGSFVVEPIDLGLLVQDTAALLQVSMSKKARLVVSRGPNLPTVEADPSQIRQIVMNLVTNASEALGENTGEIRLAIRLALPEPVAGETVYSFAEAERDYVCLEVTDTGHGMCAVTLTRIFDPFFTTKFTGRGLGLAAVLGIVRAHHGVLTVRSAPGQGSTFRLFLPVSPVPHTELPPTPATTRASDLPAGRGALLVADDEPLILSALDLMLRQAGYETVLAADGSEALRYFAANPRRFAGALLDLMMPGLNGSEVLREIRLIDSHVRVLLMSGYTEQDVLKHLEGQEPVAILRKPFTQETFLTRVAALVAESGIPA